MERTNFQTKRTNYPRRLATLNVKVFKQHHQVHFETHTTKHSVYIKLFATQNKIVQAEQTVSVSVGVCIAIPHPAIGVLTPPQNLPDFCCLRAKGTSNFNFLPNRHGEIIIENTSKVHTGYVSLGDHIATLKVYYPIGFQVQERICGILTKEQEEKVHKFPHFQTTEEENRGDYLRAICDINRTEIAFGDNFGETNNPTK